MHPKQAQSLSYTPNPDGLLLSTVLFNLFQLHLCLLALSHNNLILLHPHLQSGVRER
jgi:hypothetical protein